MQNIKENFKLKSTCVYDAILGAILHGDLKAGEKLSETGLAERLGASAAPRCGRRFARWTRKDLCV